MGCGTTKDGAVAGCSSGGCSSGGCNRMNVFNWLTDMPLSFNENFNIVEISFKSGARKGFYRNTQNLELYKGQIVVVEAAQGHDVGEVSLQGELVKAQMKKRKVTERDDTIRNIMRIGSEADIDILVDVRSREQETLIRARAVSRSLNIEMKIGDIEYQGDGKKVTIYYTADGRIDFRELVKVYAKEFKVKIEMRQIGARQESARIGGIGTCGRELCCSTWLGDFKSVTTQAVRYQNLAINTDKLSGQCGRLKCCLNYELDTYNDALRSFPKQTEKIETEEGVAWLRKTEILKKQLIYEYEHQRGVQFKLGVEDAKELLWMNKAGKKPKSLMDFAIVEEVKTDESKHEDLVGQVSLSTLEEKERRKRRQHHKDKGRPQQQNRPKQQGNQEGEKTETRQENKGGNRDNRGGNRNTNKGGNRDNRGGNRGDKGKGDNTNEKKD